VQSPSGGESINGMCSRLRAAKVLTECAVAFGRRKYALALISENPAGNGRRSVRGRGHEFCGIGSGRAGQVIQATLVSQLLGSAANPDCETLCSDRRPASHADVKQRA
jgi:hypothetical protein